MNAEKKSDWYLARKKMLRHEKYLIEKDQGQYRIISTYKQNHPAKC